MFENLFKRTLLFVDDGPADGAGGESEGKDDVKAEKSLSGSIDAAAEEIEKELRKDEKDEKDDKSDDSDDKNDESKDDDEDEDDEKEKELSAEELIHAKNLFKLLNNEKTAVGTLKTLANAAGVELKDVETKKEVNVAAKTIKDKIREGLGDDYKFLGEKLGAVIESVLADAIKDQTKDIREKQENDAKAATMNAVKDAQVKVSSEYVEIPTRVLQEVLRIQVEQEILPGKAAPEKFFKTCLTMAAENLGVTLVKKTPSNGNPDVKKKERSPLDALSESRGSHKEGVKSTQVKSINDAIAAAVDMVESTKK